MCRNSNTRKGDAAEACIRRRVGNVPVYGFSDAVYAARASISSMVILMTTGFMT